MAQIPDNPVTLQDLTVWFQMVEQLNKLKATEMLMRKRIFNAYFPDPKEGTNTFLLPDGYQLKGVHVVNRKVDEPALTVLTPAFQEKQLKLDDLIQRKPTLSVSAYRELTDEERTLFDQALIIDIGSPSLKIEDPPKKKVKAGEKAS